MSRPVIPKSLPLHLQFPPRKPPKLKVRKSQSPHRLPAGWRWLKDGEWVKSGDKHCDPQLQPIEIVVDRAWKMDAGCHPVRRKVRDE